MSLVQITVQIPMRKATASSQKHAFTNSCASPARSKSAHSKFAFLMQASVRLHSLLAEHGNIFDLDNNYYFPVRPFM